MRRLHPSMPENPAGGGYLYICIYVCIYIYIPKPDVRKKSNGISDVLKPCRRWVYIYTCQNQTSGKKLKWKYRRKTSAFSQQSGQISMRIYIKMYVCMYVCMQVGR
jgi:hypothetical protein